MTDPIEALGSGAARILGRPLSREETASFSKYLKLLLKWQKHQRLAGSNEPRWIVDNLFLDSLLFLRVVPESATSLLDLGSGAGVPGIPIKIVRPHIRLVLVESRRRRASFLSAVVRDLALDDARVVAGRVEDSMAELSGRFDAVVMRCAGNLEALLPSAVSLLRPSGIVVAAGPPEPRPTALGEWVTVEGIEPGRPRRFLVVRHPRP